MSAEIIIKAFDSPLNFLDWASNAPAQWSSGNCESRKVGNADWAGTRTYQEAEALARYGWPDGLKLLVEKIHLADAALEPKPGVGRAKKHSVAGYYPNPARAAAGEMLSMVQPLRPKVDPGGNLVKIRYDICRARSVDTSTIMNMGAALVSYINMLEESRYVVHLEAYSETKPSSQGSALSFRFPLKKAGCSLFAADLVFWLAHPAALRRIEFSAMERLDIEKWYAPGYGKATCVTPPPADTLYLRIDDAGRDVKTCLENIRRKHGALLMPNAPLKARLDQLQL
jgi:hypothetical protein